MGWVRLDDCLWKEGRSEVVADFGNHYLCVSFGFLLFFFFFGFYRESRFI